MSMATKQQNKSWYEQNKVHHRKRVDARKREIIEWFDDYKSTLKCEGCGFKHPAVIKFHHLDPSKKDLDVSTAVRRHNWCKERILLEIAKCKVLCGNCHDILHWELKQ